MNSRGQVLLETVLHLGFVVVLVLTTLQTLYFCFARLVFDRAVYEALICLAETRQVKPCERGFRKHLARTLPIGRLRRLSFSVGPMASAFHANATWTVGPLFELSAHQTLSLKDVAAAIKNREHGLW